MKWNKIKKEALVAFTLHL